MSRVVSSIDIGNSKIICLIAELSDNGKIQVKSASLYESSGVVNGNIVDINLATQAIVKAITKAEKIFKKNIDILSVSISGYKVKSKICTTEMNLGADKTIDRKNILFLSDNLKESLEKKDKTMIHAVPLNFYVNDIKIENPLNMPAKNLKVKFHVLCAARNKVDNFVNCLKTIQLKVDSFVFNAYASALATMTDDEKQINVLVVDVGSSQTSFAIMSHGKFAYGDSIPFGGNAITNDLKDVLKTNFGVAENIKHLNTNLFFSDIENKELIKINITNNDKNLYRISQEKKGLVNDVFKERFLEIMRIVFDILKSKKLDDSIDRVILCGGTANVSGLDVFVSEKIKIDTRIGYINGDNFSISHNIDKDVVKGPSYATSMGILKYLADLYREENISSMKDNNNFVNKVIDFLINLFIS